MGKRSKKINMQTVLTAGCAKQGMLFEDAFTDVQQDVLDAADGTRTVASIAQSLEKPKDKIIQIINKLTLDGYLRIAETAETLLACEKIIQQGRLDDGIGLYAYVLQDDKDNLEVMGRLAELYERTAHAKEAASIYRKMSDSYLSKSRFGEALVALRRAAGLQAGNYKVQDDLATLCVQTGRLDEAARVWRAYAMRLAGVGEYAQALDIVDNACKIIVGSDTLLFAEAEILSMMDGKGKVHDLDTTDESELENIENIPDENESSLNVEALAKEFDSEGEDTVLGSQEEVGRGLVLDMSQPSFDEDAELGITEDEIATIKRESDRDYSDLRLRDYNVTHMPKKGRGVWLVLLFVILILLTLAGVNYYYRANMYSAVMESMGIGSLMQGASLLEKIEIGDNALSVLENSKPPFEFMQSSEFVNQEARLKQLVADSDEILLHNNLEFDALLVEWGNRHNATLAKKILEFSKSDSIGRERRDSAGELYRQWLKEKDQKARELQDFIDVLADKKLAPQLRFSAYRNLLMNFPSVFEKQYPLGAKGLTVPCKVIAELANTKKSISVNLTGAKKSKDGYWEIPVDPESNVVIEHRGYEFEYTSSDSGKTRMPYPLTFEQLFVMKKAPILKSTAQFNFVAEAGKRVGNSSEFVFANRDEFAVFDSGVSAVTRSYVFPSRVDNETLSIGLDIFELGDWLGFVSDGVMYASKVAGVDSESKVNIVGGVDAGRVVYAGFYDLELGVYDGVGAVITTYFTAETAGKVMPIDVLEVGSGQSVWSSKEVRERLIKGIISPVCSVSRVGWYFVLVSIDGSVNLVMENGDIYKTFDLGLQKGERITKDMVKLLRRSDKDYLVVGGRVFRFDQSSEINLVELWHLDKHTGKDIFVTPYGLIEYGAGELIAYNINNGSKIFDYKYKGKIGTELVSTQNRVIFTTQKAEESSPRIIALDTTDNNKPLAWEYELKSDPELLFGDGKKVYVLLKDKTFLGFDG